MLGKSIHLQVIPQQSTQTQQTCGYRLTTKTSGLFLITPHIRRLSSRNIFQNLGSFAKVSVPVKIYNPLVAVGIGSCGTMEWLWFDNSYEMVV